MPSLERDTQSGVIFAVWRDSKGERQKRSTREYSEELAWPKASKFEAEARFWEDHGEGLWRRLADAGYSPRYLHSVFVCRGQVRYDRFRQLLVEAAVKLKAPTQWVDRTRPKGKPSGKRFLFRGKKKTIDELLPHAEAGVTRAALRFRLTEGGWDVSRALSTPLLSRSESGTMGAKAQNEGRKR